MAIDTFATRLEGNMGGLNKITLIPFEKITIDDGVDFAYTGEINVYFVRQTANHSEKVENSRIGESRKINTSFIIPKVRQEVLDYFAAQKKYYVIIIADNNNNRWRVGTKKRPLLLEYTIDTGAKNSERNEVRVSLQGNQLNHLKSYVPKNKVLEILPNSLDFGVVEVSKQSAPKTFSLKNAGDYRLIVHQLVSPENITLDWAGGAIEPGETVQVSAVFEPTTNGTFENIIFIESNATALLNGNIITATGEGFIEWGVYMNGFGQFGQQDEVGITIPHTSAFTYSVRFRTPSAPFPSYMFLSCHQINTNSQGIMLDVGRVAIFKFSSPKLQRRINDASLAPDTVYRVDFVNEAGNGIDKMKAYLNGAEITTSATNNSGNLTGAPTSRLYLGAYGNGGNFFRGIIYDFTFYNIALSPEQVAEQFANNAPPVGDANIVERYRVQEEQGTLNLVGDKGRQMTLTGYTLEQIAEARRDLNGNII